MNGLIKPELFKAVGESVAGALNTALHFLDSFGETFEWTEFGNSIAAGINGFFNKFDFALLADTLNTWVDGLEAALIAAVKNISWQKIFDSAGVLLDKLELDTIAVMIGGFFLTRKSEARKKIIGTPFRCADRIADIFV